MDETFASKLPQLIAISQYYTDINFLTIPFEIYELIKSQKKLKVATDGGAIPFNSKDHWDLSLLTKMERTILLTCLWTINHLGMIHYYLDQKYVLY